MNYKALLIDVDGTLVPNRRDGIPSQKVQEAIQKASFRIHIGIASGRPLFLLSHIFDMLSLSGPSILRGGAQIYDVTTGKIVKEQKLAAEDIKKAAATVWRLGLKLQMDGEDKAYTLSEQTLPQTAWNLFITRLSEKKAATLVDKLSQIPTIAVYTVPDWTPGLFTVNITHASATKQHGILEVAQTLGIQTHEIIGIGDGGNDFPLLMACGLKVAMGNALPDLKAIADYIAPTVEEDGVADVIEKFILT